MITKLQIVSAIILVIGLLIIVSMIKKRSLELKYALSWLAVIVLLILVDLFPPILNFLSYIFGIATPVNTLFVLGFCFALVLIFVLTVAVSKLSDKVRQLAQTVALNEDMIQKLTEKIEIK